jgi:hypothetical protein
MLRFVLSVVALAGVLVTAQPAFADPLAATASDHAQTAVPAVEQPAPQASAQKASSPDAPAPANSGRGTDINFIGFGWG